MEANVMQAHLHLAAKSLLFKILLIHQTKSPQLLDWLQSSVIGCSDYNFDGLPNADEYEMKTLSSPYTRLGESIFLTDWLMIHAWTWSVFLFHYRSRPQNNAIAMGGGPVCPASIPCGYVEAEQTPNWDNDLGTYRIRVEFEPQLDLDNSTILGHDDEASLHPGIPYTAQIVLSDRNDGRIYNTFNWP